VSLCAECDDGGVGGGGLKRNSFAGKTCTDVLAVDNLLLCSDIANYHLIGQITYLPVQKSLFFGNGGIILTFFLNLN
jgi:hypothetical protein